MGLLDYVDPDALRGKLKGLLGSMPVVQMAQGQAQMPTRAGLLSALRDMPVFSPNAGESAYEAAMQIGPMGLGKIVYHGSPHKFDKFDASKIGTGEGAQAYGHGVYLADSEGVAQSYKAALGAGRGAGDADTMARVLDAVGGDAAKAADVLRRRAQHANIPGGKERLLSMADQVAAGVDPRGSLYKADLPDEWIPKMLDWDKPLSEQPEALASLNSLADKLPRNVVVDVASGKRVKSTLTGRDFYNRVAGNPDPLSAIGPRPAAGRPIMGAAGAPGIMEYDEMGQAAAARLLGMGGIPGIRYLDGGSRGKGQGSYNYVVFPGLEDKVKILERNGIPINDGLLGRK